ncbi:hypothetical protein JCM19037_4658 [Geomicrobium sp. JCM 19037]|uniref:hypothetical protein n=1 Tax=Geomicrobium sp. JCM 19037 TaxID=1460634 RepID=UPI00045F49ED|nr:hypothetical protein [Geomicrobium sp. JCM 19037]GAK06097.1 hypothetical protein JCM19037_4658 [Geomicrobium sp. JCM 19037]
MRGNVQSAIYSRFIIGLQILAIVLMMGALPAHAEDNDRMYFDYESDTVLTEGDHATDGSTDSGGWIQGAWDWLTATGSDAIDYASSFLVIYFQISVTFLAPCGSRYRMQFKVS